MAIAFVSYGTGSGNSTSFTITAPGGISAGDVLVAFIVNSGAPVVTPPAGWDTYGGHGSTVSQTVYYKVATGSEPSDYTWASSSAQDYAGVIVCYSGVDNTTPINTSSHDSGTAETTVVAPSVLPSVTGNWLVGGFVSTETSGFAVDPNMTGRTDISAGVAALCVADENYGLVDFTGDRTATTMMPGDWTTFLVVLAPSGGGGGGSAPEVSKWLPSRADRVLRPAARRGTLAGADPTAQAALGFPLPPPTVAQALGWSPVTAERPRPTPSRAVQAQTYLDPSVTAALSLPDPSLAVDASLAWLTARADRVPPTRSRAHEAQALADPPLSAVAAQPLPTFAVAGQASTLAACRPPRREGGTVGVTEPNSTDTAEVVAALQPRLQPPARARRPVDQRPLPEHQEVRPLSPAPIGPEHHLAAWAVPLDAPRRLPRAREPGSLGPALYEPAVAELQGTWIVQPVVPNWPPPPARAGGESSPPPAVVADVPGLVVLQATADVPRRPCSIAFVAAVGDLPRTATAVTPPLDGWRDVVADRVLAVPRVVPGGASDPPLARAAELPVLAPWQHQATTPARSTPQRPGPESVTPPPGPLVEQPGWPLWEAAPVVPVHPSRVPPGQGGSSALLPLPEASEALLSVTALAWPGPRVVPHAPPAVAPTGERSAWWPALQVESLLAWHVPTVVPVQVTPALPTGGTESVPLPGGDGLAWIVPTELPRPSPYRFPWSSDPVAWAAPLPAGVVVVAGPYYAIAGQVYCAGAVAGEVVTE